MLRPRERRRPQMPNAFPKMIEERIVPCRSRALTGAWTQTGVLGAAEGDAGRDDRLGERRVEGHLPPRAEHLRQAPGADRGYAAPYEPPRDPGPEQHIDVDRPGELVGIDCLYVGD